MRFALFLLGAVFGSFLNVVSLRYDPDKFILGKHLLGRSHCPSCKRTLRFYELVPILSFVFQRGRCRSCLQKISAQYPVVEFLSGLIFVLVPSVLPRHFMVPPGPFVLLAVFFTVVFLTLLLISIIDIHTYIIPDEANVFLALLAAPILFIGRETFDIASGSFVGPYALLLGVRENIWTNHFLGALVGFLLFGFLAFITRGRGMGMGDVKLATALGLLFGWPDILIITMLGFVIGSVVGLGAICTRKKTIKGALPFGPFLAAASFLVFLVGPDLLRWYFGLINF